MVSVVIPVYNVELYLSKCLDSLAAQSLSDVEFLVIDDGSTDKSGCIADLYSSDSRFRIFHTSNNGLSETRNFGIRKANGNWIMFVDGDDWVSPRFCEIPYSVAMENDADIVIFNSATDDEKILCLDQPERVYNIVSHETAIEFGQAAAWNKLYKKELFENIRFPRDMVFEDWATTHKVVYKANIIAMIPDVLYCHKLRADSISHTLSIKTISDSFHAVLIRYDDLIRFGYPADKLEHELISNAISYLVRVYPSDSPLYLKAEEIVDTIKYIPDEYCLKRKALLKLWKYDKGKFHMLCSLLRKKCNA